MGVANMVEVPAEDGGVGAWQKIWGVHTVHIWMLIDPKLAGKRTKMNFKVIRTLSCSVKSSPHRRGGF